MLFNITISIIILLILLYQFDLLMSEYTYFMDYLPFSGHFVYTIPKFVSVILSSRNAFPSFLNKKYSHFVTKTLKQASLTQQFFFGEFLLRKDKALCKNLASCINC